MAQGRRDFLFGIDQGARAFRQLEGPEGAVRRPARARAIDVPGRRHRRSSCRKCARWFDCFLAQTPCSRAPAAFAITPETFSGNVAVARNAPPGLADVRLVPRRHDLRAERKGRSDIRAAPQADRDLRGADRADVDRGERRLVAARRRPHGSHTAGEGDPRGRRRRAHEGAALRRSRSSSASQATFVPKGSRLSLTLASSSTAQSSANLLYLDLPMAQSARARVGTAILKLPGLRTPVTK